MARETRGASNLSSLVLRAKELLETNYGTHRGFIRLALANAEYALGRLADFSDRDVSSAQRLVFVCRGNINRSCFAEQVARRQGARAVSVGLRTTTGAPAFPSAVAIAPLFKVDLTGHRATDYADYTPAQDDLLFCMEVRHARELVSRGVPPRSVRLLGRWATPIRLHIHDPHLLAQSYMNTCFTTIDSAVTNLVEELRSAGAPATQGRP